MALPSPKELKKLAAACRSAGIVQFKCDGIEFTLSDIVVKPQRAKKAKPGAGNRDNVSLEDVKSFNELDEMSMLMWSTGASNDIVQGS